MDDVKAYTILKNYTKTSHALVNLDIKNNLPNNKYPQAHCGYKMGDIIGENNYVYYYSNIQL